MGFKSDQFKNPIGFILAAAGSAVGLGNIWGFPYHVGEGGGAIFVLIYLFFCFALCLPVMLVEIAIGRKSGCNQVGAYAALGFPKWRFVGYLGVLSGVLILSSYNVIAGWSFGYVWEMASGNYEIAVHFDRYKGDAGKIGLYALLFMTVTAFFVSRGVSGGIERVARVLMPLLVIMIFGMALYALSLDKHGTGLSFYLKPRLAPLLADPSIVYKAMGQAFFSLSLGMGALVTFGSYVKQTENLMKSATIITLADVSIALLAGLMIFPFLGYMAGEGEITGVKSGPPLIFEAIPGIFEQIAGASGWVLGVLFFLLLCFAALTSTLSLLEVPVAFVVQEWKVGRTKAAWMVAGVIFLVGLPSLLSQGAVRSLAAFVHFGDGKWISFMDLVGQVANNTFLPLGGFLTALFAAYAWKKENLISELSLGNPDFRHSVFARYLQFSMKWLIPWVLGFVLIYTILFQFFRIDLWKLL